ncbi:MAG: class I SAM-dependent methyltransferase [Bacilli bacterium]
MKTNIERFFDEKAPTWDQSAEKDLARISDLLDSLPLARGMKVLDVACGTGIITPLLANKTGEKTKGIDISSEMIKVAKQKYNQNNQLEFECEDFLSFKETGYDFIIIFNAYPHFLEPKKVCLSLANAIKPNGYFAILHDISRKTLHQCHSHCQNISRELETPEKEAAVFEDDFKILRSEESDSHYLILGQKK